MGSIRRFSTVSVRSQRRIPSRRNGSSSILIPVSKADSSILSIFKCLPSSSCKEHEIPIQHTRTGLLDFRWYLEWLAQQARNLPDSLIELIKDHDTLASTDFGTDILARTFVSLNRFVRESPSPSIDEIVQHLQKELIFESVDDGTTSNLAQRLLVFAVLGWQTMLYLPSFNTCPLSQLEIHQNPGQPDSRLVYDTFRMSADLADRPMAVLLKGYGNLLPARCEGLTKVASETSRVASSWNPIRAAEMNAYFLVSFLNISIRWVDTFALHLDYDKASKTLSLFKYPSICAATLETTGALYAFASLDLSDLDPRADFDTITEILQETLLSYRLLFGQEKASRKYFKRLADSDPSLIENPDPFLFQLCAKKLCTYPSVPQDRFTYFTHRDFPVLGERVELLEKELRGTKPKNWKDLVRDSRDTTQYWTFWLVAIFGVSSLLLSLAQVIMGGLALAKS